MALFEYRLNQFERRVSAGLLLARLDAAAHLRAVNRWLRAGCWLQPVLRFLRKCEPAEYARRRGVNLAADARFATVSQSAGSESARTQLHRCEAPKLFSLIDDLNNRAGLAGVENILLDEQLNASVMTAYTGFPAADTTECRKIVLIIGRPLLAALSIEELRAVLAHELGHFVGAKGRLAVKCQAQHCVWASIDNAFENGGRRHKKLYVPLLQASARWYTQRFFARAFPVYRDAEHEADGFAARITGPDTVARALIRLAIAREREYIEPGASSDAALLYDCLQEDTGIIDPHPCLRDRLSELNVAPSLPPALTHPAISLLACATDI